MNKNKHKLISLWFLFVITFLFQMISGVVGIAVPIYATLLGAPPFIVGLIGAAGGLIYSFMPMASGMLCDRLNRKAFIMASLIFYGFSCLLYSLIREPFMLVFIKVLEWLSISIFWPAIEALMVDSTDVKFEETLRRFNISWGSAMVIGPIIGGVLISRSVEAPFLFSLFVALSSGLLNFVIVKEPPRRRDGDVQSTIGSRDNVDGQASIIIALTSVFLFSSVDGIILSLFPSYATGLEIPAYEIGLITFAFGAARVLTFYQANWIEAKIGKISMFLSASLTLALASLITYNSSNTLMFTICFLVFGLGTGIAYAASISSVLRRWRSTRGYAAGIFESLIGLGYFVGPFIGGIVSEYDLKAPYLLGFLLSLVICAVQLTVSMRSPKLRSTNKHPS